MAFNPTSPLTGVAVTGLTSPTFTFVADTMPNPLQKGFYVTALGGTQTGVLVHSISSPFTLSIARPASLKTLGTPNPVNGRYPSVPQNTYNVRVRKGVNIAANQPASVATADIKVSIPAGAETYDPNSIAALLSLAASLLSQQADGLLSTAKTGNI